jgi:hypothetical protein
MKGNKITYYIGLLQNKVLLTGFLCAQCMTIHESIFFFFIVGGYNYFKASFFFYKRNN